jgi:hypothetical protein
MKPMKNKITLAAITIGGLLAGCATHDQVGIETALQQLGGGLAGMRAAELQQLTNSVFVTRGQTNFSTGLFVTDASVTFNITTSKNKSNQLVLDVSTAIPQSPVTGKVGDTFSTSSSVTKANQITVNFASPLFTVTTTTTKQTNGAVETKVEKTITNPTNIVGFYNAITHGTNGVDSPGALQPGPFFTAHPNK